MKLQNGQTTLLFDEYRLEEEEIQASGMSLTAMSEPSDQQGFPTRLLNQLRKIHNQSPTASLVPRNAERDVLRGLARRPVCTLLIALALFEHAGRAEDGCH
jgi:hypothetical protein